MKILVLGLIAIAVLLSVSLFWRAFGLDDQPLPPPPPPKPPAVHPVVPTSTTTTTQPPTTTTTAVARTAPPVHAASASRPAPEAAPVAPVGTGVRSISSTMYSPCSAGTTMANGQHVHLGAVSSKVLPRGTRWRVLSGPKAGEMFTVEDTGSRAYFDMWTPSCDEAIQYGRRQIDIEAA